MSTLKILMINSFYYHRGGDCTYTFALSDLLQQKGHHRIIYFSMKHPLNLQSPYSEYFVPEIDLLVELKKNKFKSGIKVLKRAIYSNISKRNIKRLIEKYQPDIAHVHNIHGHITPSIFHILKAKNIPIVWTLHDSFLLCPNSHFFTRNEICERCKAGKFFYVVIKRCRKDSFAASFIVMLEEYVYRLLGLLKLVDYFIAPSEFLKNKLIEFNFFPEKIINIPNFIDTKNINVTSKRDDYILYSGRLSFEKGLDTLIDAVSLCNSTKLLIAGAGPLKNELKKRALLKAPGKIEFLGHLEKNELMKVISGSMFVVVPSKCHENFPYTVLEAFATGKSVVGSRVGGIPELVEDYQTGLLFSPGNVNELADRIQWLLNNSDKAEEMGEKAKDLVEKMYNPYLHYKQVLKVYKMALVKHNRYNQVL